MGSWPALIAAFWAENVVATIGHPFPGPSKFCRVTAAALRRADWEAFESSVGNESCTVGFVRTWPAATLAFSFC